MDRLPALGTDIKDVLSPTLQIYTELLQQNASAIHSVSKERETHQYGQHPRQNLDIYTPKVNLANSPIILWAHGGGLVAGDKNLRISGDLVYSNAGYFFASRGFTAVVINYRLVNTHDAKFPSGGEDIAEAIEWITKHFQGQKRDLFGLGNSAGGIHWSTFLFYPTFHSTLKMVTTGDGIRLRGVTLLSVPFEFSKAAADRADALQSYYGDDLAQKCPYGLMNLADDSVWEPLERGKVQIHVGSVSLDPEDEILSSVRCFVSAWKNKRSSFPAPKLIVSTWGGHNHISPFLALGTDIAREEEWGNDIVEWMRGDFEGSAK
ncbi:alpha beta-hydrolase [Fusarium acutatum]|uniref:Alpha beta-hydrolase n=1 Tax=Fusarium acutatum TaxID=78861 RepID=A0A8H4NG55_9HYPO|nr:alpha beta-hydrolase [Fusarium acutatum]